MEKRLINMEVKYEYKSRVSMLIINSSISPILHGDFGQSLKMISNSCATIINKNGKINKYYYYNKKDANIREISINTSEQILICTNFITNEYFCSDKFITMKLNTMLAQIPNVNYVDVLNVVDEVITDICNYVKE